MQELQIDQKPKLETLFASETIDVAAKEAMTVLTSYGADASIIRHALTPYLRPWQKGVVLIYFSDQPVAA